MIYLLFRSRHIPLLPCSRQATTGILNGAIFIDLKKAFDTIDHEIILEKLYKYRVDALKDALKCPDFKMP